MAGKIERIKPSLAIDDDIDLHIVGWIVQRIGWAVMLIFVMLAAAGLFGDGLLSEERLSEGNTTIEFQKYLRRDSDTEIAISASPDGKVVRLGLSDGFNDLYKVERVMPEPEHQSISPSGVEMEFSAAGQARITLFLSVRKHKAGRANVTLFVNGSAFSLSSFTYP